MSKSMFILTSQGSDSSTQVRVSMIANPFRVGDYITIYPETPYTAYDIDTYQAERSVEGIQNIEIRRLWGNENEIFNDDYAYLIENRPFVGYEDEQGRMRHLLLTKTMCRKNYRPAKTIKVYLPA